MGPIRRSLIEVGKELYLVISPPLIMTGLNVVSAEFASEARSLHLPGSAR